MKRFSLITLSLIFILGQSASTFAWELPTQVTVVNVSESDISEPDDMLPADIPTSLILINEVLADPVENDAENEFIELFNPGSQPVDVSGWKLDDARADDGAYTFGIGVILEPFSYLVLYRPETRITLNNDTDSVFLWDAEGRLIDSFEFSSQGSGRSWGRHPDHSDAWLVFKHPSPGLLNAPEVNAIPVAVISVQKDTRKMKLNVTGAESFDPDGDRLSYLWEFEEGVNDERENPLIYEYAEPGEKTVRLTVTDSQGDSAVAEILFTASFEEEEPEFEPLPRYYLFSEAMPDPEGRDTDNEWIELYNQYSSGLDLSGWYLDDGEGDSRPYRIPDGTIIYGNSYLVFSEPGLGLSFKNSEDVIRILDPYKFVNQEVAYAEAKENWSYAKKLNGDYAWTPLGTPGAGNVFPLPPKNYRMGDVVFEAVLPNPEGEDPGYEQIILKNVLNESVDLLSWTLADASGTARLLPSFVLAAGESRAMYSSEFRLSLNNSDERLILNDAAGNLIDEIKWKSSASGQWLFNPDSLTDGMMAQVIRTIDGDTLVVDFNERRLTIRLIGVDTPETVHPFKPIEYYGKQASQFLSDILTDKQVKLEFDENKIDKYGRVLAYVFLDDEMLNRTIIEKGYGYAYTRFPFRYLDEFESLELKARESGIGLWQNLKVMEVLDQIIEAQLMLEEEGALPEEELLLLLEDEIEEELLEEVPVMTEEVLLESLPDCRSEYLKIDSFLPNPQKGEAVEYIRLRNTGTEQVCLAGWILDDATEKGSKPFNIRGGAIAPGGIRTFRKEETKLALNNKDDCVNLIDPDGQIADQICYGSTHKNEIFTHAGGDWVPKPKAKKAVKSAVATLRHRFSREFASYQSDLFTRSHIGRISAIDEDAEIVTLRLEKGGSVGISYAHSPVNMTVTKELIDFAKPVRVRVYESGDSVNLLAIEPLIHSLQLSSSQAGAGIPGGLLLGLISLGSLFYFRRSPQLT